MTVLTISNRFSKFNRESDMIVGGICPSDVNFGKMFEVSTTYKQDDMTWCVSHAKPIPRWMNIFYMADLRTFIISEIIILAVIGVYYLLYAFENPPRDLFYCAILVLQTVTTFPTMFRSDRITTKLLFALTLLITFWLTEIFGAYIIVFLGEVRYETQIATVNELFEGNFRLAGNPHVIDHFRMKIMVRLLRVHLVSSNK